MSRIAVGVVLFLIVAAPHVFAQEFTTADVLKNLDEKARVFKSLQASLKKQHVSSGFKAPEDSGTITMTMVKGSPRVLFDIQQPRAQKNLIDNGKATQYNVEDNTYKEYKFDPKSELLQFVVLGFGTSAATITRGYKAEVKNREMTGGINTVVLGLTSIDKSTDAFPFVTLWLDPRTWAPVQTRIGQSEKSYEEFRYSDVQLNRPVPGSAFDLKKRPGAKKL